MAWLVPLRLRIWPVSPELVVLSVVSGLSDYGHLRLRQRACGLLLPPGWIIPKPLTRGV